METAVLKPGVRLGAFELEQKIALGGMAEIWSAREIVANAPGRRVALKVLQPFFAQDEALVAMFQDEVALATRLEHPNIVRTYGGYTTGEWVYQAMELLDGVDIRRILSELARTGAWIKVPLALRIGRDVALGLEHAHKLKSESGTPLEVVHRDISPHNVMLTKDGQVKVIDFGIARAAERMTQTKTGIIKGKLSYMAPEQALSHPVTPRTDIFALGVVLWELLTMRRLFRGKNDIESISLVAECNIPKIDDLNPMLPESASALINAMLAKDPEDRPGSMAQVAGRFEAVLERGFDEHAYTDLALAAFVGELIEPRGARRQTRVFEVSSPSKEENAVAERGHRAQDPAATPPGTGPVKTPGSASKDVKLPGSGPKKPAEPMKRPPSEPVRREPEPPANLLHEPSLPVQGPSLAHDLALGLTAPGSLAAVSRVEPGALLAYANLPDDSTDLPIADTHIPSADPTDRLSPVGSVFDEPTEASPPSQPQLQQLLVQLDPDETVLQNPNLTPPPSKPKIQIPDAKTAPTSRPAPRKPRPR